MVIFIIYAYICHVLDAEIIFLLTEEIRFLVTEIGPWGHFSLEARPPDSLVTLHAPEILKSLQINKLKLIKLHQKRSRKVAVCTLAKGFLRNSTFSKVLDHFLKRTLSRERVGFIKSVSLLSIGRLSSNWEINSNFLWLPVFLCRIVSTKGFCRYSHSPSRLNAMALTFEKTFLMFFEKGSCKTLRFHKILRSYQKKICKSWLGKDTETRAS